MMPINYSSLWKQISSTAITLVSISLLAACSMNKDIVPFTPMAIDDASAAIYVYRPKAMANAMYAPDFYVDDELKFPVKNGNYSRLMLPAGDHQLKLDAGENLGQQEDVSLSAESTYYVRVTTSLKIDNSINYQPYKRSFFMEVVAEDEALTEISTCCATTLKDSTHPDPVVTDTDSSDGGFSVDKTQNPFSH